MGIVRLFCQLLHPEGTMRQIHAEACQGQRVVRMGFDSIGTNDTNCFTSGDLFLAMLGVMPHLVKSLFNKSPESITCELVALALLYQQWGDAATANMSTLDVCFGGGEVASAVPRKVTKQVVRNTRSLGPSRGNRPGMRIRCSSCGRWECGTRTLQKCSGCGITRYCDGQCQKW